MNDPLARALGLAFSKDVVDGIFYYLEKLDDYEKKHRYEDSTRKFVDQALRLYEQGKISKSQLLEIIKMIPDDSKADFIDVEARTASTSLVRDLNNLFRQF